MEGIIFNIKRYALHDGPGIRTTVFLKGCPLSCPWCHNPEGIAPEPQPMFRNTEDGEMAKTVGRVVSVKDLVAALEKDVLFYDESGGGVTFSGGEPLSQPGFLEAAVEACNQRDLHTVLDTSGYTPPEVAERLFPFFRLLLYDIKLMDEKTHRRLTGVSNRIILENLQRADTLGVPFRIRVPVVPGVTDDEANIREIVRIAKQLKALEGVDLLSFHRIGEGKYRRLKQKGRSRRVEPPTQDRLTSVQRHFASAGLPVTIGGQP